jgi:hypothetical protein
MRKAAFFTAILLGLAPGEILSQERWVTINPGVKIGYVFGENGGWHSGFEVSLVSWNTAPYNFYYGYLIEVEEFRGTTMIHLGVEGGSIGGASIGPSLLLRDGASDVGLTTTFYAGPYVIPFVSYTLPVRFEPRLEAGTYAKLPFTLSGHGDMWH